MWTPSTDMCLECHGVIFPTGLAPCIQDAQNDMAHIRTGKLGALRHGVCCTTSSPYRDSTVLCLSFGDVKLTGVFARKLRPTQTPSVDTQYIPPWVSKISSDIMAYGEAGNGNGNRNRRGKWKSEFKKLLHGTVYNYWTGLTQTTSFSVVQKLYVLIKHITCS